MKKVALASLALSLAIGIVIPACMSTEQSGQESMAPPFGGPDDLSRASRLWSAMSGYQHWSEYPGLTGWQKGKSPHGKYLKYFINSAASRNPTSPGSIIVKQNYGDRRDEALGAVTVMEKIPGYDPENGDWFWVKFDPKGNVMKNEMGMSLAGRVAKGMSKGCIACHSNAAGGDFLFVND